MPSKEHAMITTVRDIGYLSEIYNHLEYIHELCNRYAWTKDELDVIRRGFDDIKAKQNDKKLNLSIIGEFSTGKSTFINALTGDNLMVSKALQGTTAAATVAEYGEHYGLKVIFNNGKQRSFKVADLTNLKDAVSAVTTNSKIARELHSVYLTLPCEGLRRDIRIIDTPGTNVEKLWHEEVTVRAIRELSDISIVLIDATHVLPESLIQFIRDNLEQVLSKCVFVVTKIDCIRPKERPSIIKYVQMKLTQEFGLKDAVVLPYSSIDMMGYAGISALPGEDAKFDPELVRISQKSQEQIFDHTSRNRTVIQAKKVLELTERVYSFIASKMSDMQSNFENKLRIIERTKKIDLTDFLDEKTQKYTARFSNASNPWRTSLSGQLRHTSEISVDTLLINFDACTDSNELREFIRSVLVSYCVSASGKMAALCRKKLSDINNEFSAIMKDFQHDFEELFENLEILPVNTNSISIKVKQMLPLTLPDFAKAINNSASTGGLSGFAGGFIFNSSSVEKLKNRTRPAIENELKKYFGETEDALIGHANEQIRKTRNLIAEQIKKYHENYNSLVEDAVEAVNTLKKFTEANIRIISRDKDELNKRKSELDKLNLNIF